GGAACVRDDVVLGGVVHGVVHAEHYGDVLILGGSGDENFLDAVVPVSDGLGGVGKAARALQHDVDAVFVPGDGARVGLSEDVDALAVHINRVVVVVDVAREGPVGAVVFEKMRVGFGVGEIVHRDDLE